LTVPETFANLADVYRSGFLESRHLGSLLALHPDGSVALSLGDPAAEILPRSTYKPLQALGVIRSGLELDSAQLAIAIGSHGGSDQHVAAVRSILQRYGISEDLLGCPVDYPEDQDARERMIKEGVGKLPICMNCSGKHAAMLAACVVNQWPTDSYLDKNHPLQQLIKETIEQITGEKVSTVAVDGCGVPLFSTTVQAVAKSFRALALAEAGSLEFQIADAMRSHPFLIAGTNQPNTLTMEIFPGSIAKGGAEGVLGMATESGASVGLKVIDGSLRATTVIAVAALEKIGALPKNSLADNKALGVMVYGGGKEVGQIVPAEALL